ncbi:hypothetical protein P775_16640 [Puniceibacterium antarcticum]|uniref:Uncharacterized protein n=1 Tax=Puniceibacterium antarcticum TaxID=1206336 RepID=A0A2G8RC10_9RHOB|nr:FAD-dependent oxidoreductase [Puniceibacterium antarcticum]PIL19070.1 hypothetical protein P775_16640 [Puniceibacterium antarcticum]
MVGLAAHRGGKTGLWSDGGLGYASIPLYSLRVRGLENLLRRIIGAAQVAYGSVRPMGTAFATGHPAGLAAVAEDLATGEAIDATVCRLGGMT